MAAPGRDAIEAACRLWHGSFDGVLSTQSLSEPGYPFGSVVPFCLDRTGRPLLLLSHIAQHYRNLAADPRCALTLFTRPSGDIQRGRRLTCMAACRANDDADALARCCRHFPNGRVYAEQLGFRLFRLEPRRFHYNGGFATARWLDPDRVLTRAPLSRDTEQELLHRLRTERADWLASLHRAPGAVPPEPVALDAWGLTLRAGERLLRFDAEQPLTGWSALAEAVDNAQPNRPPTADL